MSMLFGAADFFTEAISILDSLVGNSVSLGVFSLVDYAIQMTSPMWSQVIPAQLQGVIGQAGLLAKLMIFHRLAIK